MARASVSVACLTLKHDDAGALRWSRAQFFLWESIGYVLLEASAFTAPAAQVMQ